MFATAVPRRGDYLLTWSQIQFWPLDPRPAEVLLIDIAVGLSNECRYGGQIWPAYVVGQHSVLVAMHLPPKLRKQGLLHDATEAYLKDIPRPLKRHLGGYIGFEMNLAACIGRRFGVDLVNLDPLVHDADARALATEKRDLFNPSREKEETARPWLGKIAPWTHEESIKAFLGMAHELGVRELAA